MSSGSSTLSQGSGRFHTSEVHEPLYAGRRIFNKLSRREFFVDGPITKTAMSSQSDGTTGYDYTQSGYHLFDTVTKGTTHPEPCGAENQINFFDIISNPDGCEHVRTSAISRFAVAGVMMCKWSDTKGELKDGEAIGWSFLMMPDDTKWKHDNMSAFFAKFDRIGYKTRSTATGDEVPYTEMVRLGSATGTLRLLGLGGTARAVPVEVDIWVSFYKDTDQSKGPYRKSLWDEIAANEVPLDDKKDPNGVGRSICVEMEETLRGGLNGLKS